MNFDDVLDVLNVKKPLVLNENSIHDYLMDLFIKDYAGYLYEIKETSRS